MSRFALGLVGGRAAAAVSYVGRNDAGSGSVATFNSQGIGAAAANRTVIISVGQNSGSRPSSPTVTVNGNAATLIVARRTDYSTSASTTQALYAIEVPTGTTANIVVTWSTTVDTTAIGVWAAYGLGSLSPYDTETSGADPAAMNVDVPAGGIVVGAVFNGNNVAVGTWTGLTENYDQNFRSFYAHTGACAAYSSAQAPATVSCDIASPNVQAGVAASWGP